MTVVRSLAAAADVRAAGFDVAHARRGAAASERLRSDGARVQGWAVTVDRSKAWVDARYGSDERRRMLAERYPNRVLKA